ncbi:MAG: uroporphyrinogen-III C-methyltransferase [Hyphomicrobiales bacterium]|nr:MAG: uroporphyrinogen-III C-methyltransferase [Hyphomicrobiales bacterium]
MCAINGKVYLVGAGPGDVELLTRKAVRLIECAQVIVFDRLVSNEVMTLVPVGAARIDVGKRPHHHPVPQQEINRTLIGLARAGRMVVRLKGGDPFLFGRGGEELEALRAAGVPVEVVPGITSAQGCAASLQVPLTHRGVASSVRYITGHCRSGDGLEHDWAGLADPDTTLVVYMGLQNIRRIAAELMRHGRSPDTPALAVSRATTEDERAISGTLSRIADDVLFNRLASPTLFVIGEVTSLARLPKVESNAVPTDCVAAAP